MEMDGLKSGSSRIQDASEVQGFEQLGANSQVFDASQYAFFGGDSLEEVELGGLEDEDDDIAHVEYDEEQFQLEKEEGELLESLSEVDDLSSSFSKLNKVVGVSGNPEVSRVWGSRESSSATELAQDADFNNWIDQRSFDPEYSSMDRKWSSQPYPVSSQFPGPNSLQRTSSYPEPQQLLNQQNLPHLYSSEPVLTPKSSFTSYPPPGGMSLQASHNQQPVVLPNLPPFNNSQLPLNALPHGSHVARTLPHLPQGFPVNSHVQNQWLNQSGSFRGNPSVLHGSFMTQQMSQLNGLPRPQLRPPQHSQLTRLPQQLQSSYGQVSGLQSGFGPHFSPSPPSFDILGLPEMRDQRLIPVPRIKQMVPFSQQVADFGWTKFRSKYMSSDEIDNIVRMQLAATHSNDPYVEDYYHQACLARKSAGAKLKHHFCPNILRDSSAKPRASEEPHAFLQVDALGRVSFSSIHRPRPLLEVDSSNSSSSDSTESKRTMKPLEQEPMLAARLIIEDGISLLLDVDDIDRFLEFNPLPDGGAHLRQRRHILLEELAASFLLVDPLMKNGQQVIFSPKDDLVFLRTASLPKGRKLLVRYLQLLLPGELTRVICMAVCRNLKFLFGNLPADPGASVTVITLAETVSSCVRKMDLKALSSCLASVGYSPEHPPLLRPIGSSAGDGASQILKSVLERATELLTDPQYAGDCTPSNRSFWQASFDVFFGVLTKYCINKYDSVMQAVLVQGSMEIDSMGSEVAKAISKEIPVELLRASLPHTSEQQRKVLLEFAQRSMLVSGG